MILYDISRDILTAKVYEGDPKPESRWLMDMSKGAPYNLSQICICTHTATHIDAPLHFDDTGAAIDEIRLSAFYGKCTVVTINGILTGEDMENLLPYCKKRILFHGNGKAYLSQSAAFVLSDSDVLLVGTDGISIATEADDIKVHRELSGANIAVLEGLDLTKIKDGEYLLCAFPIKLSGLEAAPCRAILLEQEKGLG